MDDDFDALLNLGTNLDAPPVAAAGQPQAKARAAKKTQNNAVDKNNAENQAPMQAAAKAPPPKPKRAVSAGAKNTNANKAAAARAAASQQQDEDGAEAANNDPQEQQQQQEPAEVAQANAPLSLDELLKQQRKDERTARRAILAEEDSEWGAALVAVAEGMMALLTPGGNNSVFALPPTVEQCLAPFQRDGVQFLFRHLLAQRLKLKTTAEGDDNAAAFNDGVDNNDDDDDDTDSKNDPTFSGGCIFADEQGLGKTVQIASFLGAWARSRWQIATDKLANEQQNQQQQQDDGSDDDNDDDDDPFAMPRNKPRQQQRQQQQQPRLSLLESALLHKNQLRRRQNDENGGFHQRAKQRGRAATLALALDSKQLPATPLRVLIVCPTTLISIWADALRDWAGASPEDAVAPGGCVIPAQIEIVTKAKAQRATQWKGALLAAAEEEEKGGGKKKGAGRPRSKSPTPAAVVATPLVPAVGGARPASASASMPSGTTLIQTTLDKFVAVRSASPVPGMIAAGATNGVTLSAMLSQSPAPFDPIFGNDGGNAGSFAAVVAASDAAGKQQQQQRDPVLFVPEQQQQQQPQQAANADNNNNNNNKRKAPALPAHSVTFYITSYGIMKNDAATLLAAAPAFDAAILDEAQLIKDPSTDMFKGAALLKTRFRVAVTGTPLSNHFGDFWSLAHFADPSIVPLSRAEFARVNALLMRGNERNIAQGEEARARAALQQLRERLRWYVLRREKGDVLEQCAALGGRIRGEQKIGDDDDDDDGEQRMSLGEDGGSNKNNNDNNMMVCSPIDKKRSHHSSSSSAAIAIASPLLGGAGAAAAAGSFPRKVDAVIWCGLSREQGELYRKFLACDEVVAALRGAPPQQPAAAAAAALDAAATEQQQQQNVAAAGNAKKKPQQQQSPLVLLSCLIKMCDHPWLNFPADRFRQALRSPLVALPGFPESGGALSSTKVQTLLALAQAANTEGEKLLVFSRSKRLHDIVASVLRASDVPFVRLDGDVPAAARAELVRRFNDGEAFVPVGAAASASASASANPKPTVKEFFFGGAQPLQTQKSQQQPQQPQHRQAFVCLATTQVAGVGLTFNKVGKLVLADPSWNFAVDAQAVDRVHRIGQVHRTVTIIRLITCGTVEERMYRNQLHKMVASLQALGTDPQTLMRYFSHTQLRDMFTLEETRFSCTSQALRDVHRMVAGTGLLQDDDDDDSGNNVEDDDGDVFGAGPRRRNNNGNDAVQYPGPEVRAVFDKLRAATTAVVDVSDHGSVLKVSAAARQQLESMLTERSRSKQAPKQSQQGDGGDLPSPQAKTGPKRRGRKPAAAAADAEIPAIGQPDGKGGRLPAANKKPPVAQKQQHGSKEVVDEDDDLAAFGVPRSNVAVPAAATAEQPSSAGDNALGAEEPRRKKQQQQLHESSRESSCNNDESSADEQRKLNAVLCEEEGNEEHLSQLQQLDRCERQEEQQRNSCDLQRSRRSANAFRQSLCNTLWKLSHSTSNNGSAAAADTAGGEALSRNLSRVDESIIARDVENDGDLDDDDSGGVALSLQHLVHEQPNPFEPQEHDGASGTQNIGGGSEDEDDYDDEEQRESELLEYFMLDSAHQKLSTRISNRASLLGRGGGGGGGGLGLTLRMSELRRTLGSMNDEMFELFLDDDGDGENNRADDAADDENEQEELGDD